jgi:hypothetical protein
MKAYTRLEKKEKVNNQRYLQWNEIQTFLGTPAGMTTTSTFSRAWSSWSAA